MGGRPGRLAQHVRIDQVFHSASVDSDSIGTKSSFRPREQPIDDALVTPAPAYEAVFARLQSLDVKLLSGLDVILLANLSGEHDLAF